MPISSPLTTRQHITSAMASLSSIGANDQYLGADFLTQVRQKFVGLGELLRELDKLEPTRHGLTEKQLNKIETKGVLTEISNHYGRK